MAKDFHAQIKDFMTGGGSGASSTTSFVSIMEGLASDTRRMLELQTRHYSVVEKLLGAGNKIARSKDQLGLMDIIMAGWLGTSLKAGAGTLAGWLGLKKISNLLKGTRQTIQTGAVNAVKVFVDKSVGTIKSSFKLGATQVATKMTSWVKSSFSMIGNQFPKLGAIGHTVSRYGSKLGATMKGAFAWMKSGKTLGILESFGKLGVFIQGAGKYLGKAAPVMKWLGKASGWLAAAFAGWDGIMGFKNAEQLTGRKNMNMFSRLYSGFNSAGNSALFGIPDWLSRKHGFQNFNQMADQRNQGAFKWVKENMVSPLSTWLFSKSKPAKNGILNQNGVENLRHRRLSGSSAEKRAQDAARVRLGVGVNPYIQFNAKDAVTKGIQMNDPTYSTNNAAYAGSSLAMAMTSQMPRIWLDAIGDIRGGLIKAAVDMVKKYSELQREALEEQKEEEEDARRDFARKVRNGFFGQQSAYMNSASMLNSIPTSPSTPGNFNSTTSTTPNPTDVKSPTDVKPHAQRQADNSWKIGDKTYAANTKEAKKWSAMDDVAKKMYNGGKKRPEYKLSDADLSDAVVNTIAGEAIAGDQKSIDAVVNNMINRVKGKGYGPSDNMEQVARAPGQYTGYRKANQKEAELIRARIKAVASGEFEDPTKGSNEYRASSYVHGAGYGKTFWKRAQKEGFNNQGGNIYAYNENAQPGPYSIRNKDWKPTNNKLPDAFKTKDGRYGPGILGLVSAENAEKVLRARQTATNPSATVRGQDIAGVPVFQDQAQVAGTRKADVQQEVLSNVQQAVFRTLGEGYQVRVYSGGQNDKTGYKGSRRHNEGGAADLKILNKDGKQISQEEYAKVAQLYLAENMGSIGMQMKGGGVHFDKFKRGKKWGTDPDALNPNGPRPESQFWRYKTPLSAATEAMIKAGLKGENPEGAMTKSQFEASLHKSSATPTSSDTIADRLQAIHDKRETPRRGRLNSYDSLMSSVRRTTNAPTQNMVRPNLDEYKTRTKTVPDQVNSNSAKNPADNTQRKIKDDRAAATTQDNRVTVRDIPPIDEYKMTLANGSALV